MQETSGRRLAVSEKQTVMTETQFILAGNLIDGRVGDVHRNAFMAVKGTFITALGAAAQMPCHECSAILDLSHCTILPALVDCSVSLSRSPSLDSRVRLRAEEAGSDETTAMIARHIRYCHTHGVLGVADNGDEGSLIRQQREVAEQRSMIDIRTAGLDFLRIAYSGNIEERDPGRNRVAHEDLRRILLNRDGKKTVVVANGRQMVAEALAIGCDAIEQGYGMGEENLRKMAEKNVLWIPSVLRAKNALDGTGTGGDVACRFSQRYAVPGNPDPGAEAYWKKTLAGQLAQLRMAKKLGVTTAVGTGAGGVGILHGESMVEEMKLFIRAGWSLVETIRCASANGAEFFGIEDLGVLAAGRKATFLISRGTVQQLPRKLSYLEGIYVDGVPSAAYHKHPVRTA